MFPLTHSLDHVGPMTRTVEDNAILFHAIAGHDPDDPTTAKRATPDCLTDLKTGLKGLRIGVIEHFYKEDAEADPDQVRAIEQAVATLQKLGASVKTIRLSPLSLWTDCNRTIHQAEAYAIHEKDVQERPEDFAALTRNRLLPGAFVSSAKYIRAQQLRGALCREFADAMHDLDAVVTLSSLLLPCRIDDPAAIAKTYDQQCRLVFNVTGTPAISVPTGHTASRRAARHADRRPRLRRADGLSDRAGVLRGDRVCRQAPADLSCVEKRARSPASAFSAVMEPRETGEPA